MRPLRRFAAPAAGGLLCALFAIPWFRDRPPPDSPPPPPAALPQTAGRPAEDIDPVPESRAAVDMVRAAHGTVLLSKTGQVKAIVLTGARIADADLQHLAGVPELLLLNLDGTAITDEGLACIHDLPQLKILRLCRTSITDAGLGRLSGLPALESLHLDETRITDEGLRGLGEFPSLSSINALGCPLSSEAETIVRARRPHCRVKH